MNEKLEELIKLAYEIQEELKYLRWFYQHTDFGPAHEDAMSSMNERYVKLTGNRIPERYEEDYDN